MSQNVKNILTLIVKHDIIIVTISDKGRRIKMQGFGKILVRLRGNKTQEEVARAIGISTSALGMYETERRIPRDAIKIKLANYYSVSVQDIFFASNVT